VSDSLAVDAACAASGIYRVETPAQMVDLAQLLLARHRPRGGRMSIVGDGGGHVAIAADRVSAFGLRVDPFSSALSERIAAALPPTASTANPVDVAGGGEEDVWNFERAVRLIAESGESDALILTGYFGGYSEVQGAWAKEEVDVAAEMSKAADSAQIPLVVQSMYPRSPTSLKFRELGIPVYADIESVARSIGLVVDRLKNEPLGIPSVVPSPAPVIPSPARGGGSGWAPNYFSVRQLLSEAGIQFVEARRAISEDEAVAAAAVIGYPVVLKALGTSHKSDVGGVRLAIANEAALRREFADLESKLHPSLFSVEREAPIERGVELLIGVKRDRSFGPIALVGLGGLHAELFKDVAVALAPVSGDQATKLIRSLRGSELLLGWRGRPLLDLNAAAAALHILSHVAAAHQDISEIEINPLLVLEVGAVALDARLIGES
jgi:acyl-CoA synthetase (NDP forming)